MRVKKGATRIGVEKNGIANRVSGGTVAQDKILVGNFGLVCQCNSGSPLVSADAADLVQGAVQVEHLHASVKVYRQANVCPARVPGGATED